MYGMDSKFIKRGLLNIANKKSKDIASIEKYLRFNEDEKIFERCKCQKKIQNLFKK